jgi:hypothetical protein
MFKRDAIRFTTNQKAYCLTIDHANVAQIQSDVAVVRVEFEQSLQLGHRRLRESAAQDEYRDLPSWLSVDPKSHRTGHLSLKCARINEQYERLTGHLASTREARSRHGLTSSADPT